MVERVEGKLFASVRPDAPARLYPLAWVSGATNAITFTTELFGDVTIVGPGPGGWKPATPWCAIYWRCTERSTAQASKQAKATFTRPEAGPFPLRRANRR